jgi:hypothetical protein
MLARGELQAIHIDLLAQEPADFTPDCDCW